MPREAFKLALIQSAVGKDKAENIKHACEMIGDAVNGGANVVCLCVCL